MIRDARARHRAVTALQAVEYALVLAAGLAFGWYAGVQVSAAKEQASWARELEQRVAAAPAKTRGGGAATISSPARRSLIGRVELTRVGVSAIAREGVDAGTLRRAVGHVPQTALPGEPGNAAFAGHRDSFFSGLKNVRTGDRVVVTTPSGRFQYVVRQTRIVEPSDLSVLAHTAEPTLTLITCYPFDYFGSAPKRFIVQAVADRAP